MKIATISISDIVPNNWNPNEMDDHIYKSLIESIKKYGVLQPLLIRSDKTIIKGEKRWLAAKEAGIKELMCVIIESSDEEAKLLTVSLGHLRGRTNEEILASLIEELSGYISIEEIASQTGYLVDELSNLLKGLPMDTEIEEPVIDDNYNVQAALEKIIEPETKYGDLWRLGRHVLLCGDATKITDVNKLLCGEKANLVVTDPPYNVDIESESSRLTDGRNKILNDDMSVEEFNGFLKKIFENYAAIMDHRAAIYVFHPSSYQREFENNINSAGIIIRTQCIWVKNAFTFGFAQYKYKHEPVFYAFLKNNSPAWYGDLKQTTVWRAGLPVEIAEPTTVWEISRGDTSKYMHPTQKPLELLAIPISNSSKKGDLVVDFFGGSGSTLMTCEQMGRTCFIMELDPIFCDVIKNRYAEATGIKPELISRLENIA